MTVTLLHVSSSPVSNYRVPVIMYYGYLPQLTHRSGNASGFQAVLSQGQAASSKTVHRDPIKQVLEGKNAHNDDE